MTLDISQLREGVRDFLLQANPDELSVITGFVVVVSFADLEHDESIAWCAGNGDGGSLPAWRIQGMLGYVNGKILYQDAQDNEVEEL